MALAIEHVPLDSLAPYSRNARTHSAAQIKQIERSLQRFGWCTPMGKADGVLIYGHARLQAAINLRKRNVPIPNADEDRAPVVDLSHLGDDERKAYVIADNQLAAQAGWDETLLGLEVRDLNLAGFDLSLMGFSAKEMTSLLSPPSEERSGALLELINITVADPVHSVESGDHYMLADRHHLLCVSVHEDWPAWRRLLKRGTLFVPYPGPFVPFAKKADQFALIMVQPDEYAAGHLLDRFADVHGEDALKRQPKVQASADEA